MKSGHGRYESLAGALWLGEATVEERAVFVAHAERCAVCAADLAEIGPSAPAADGPALRVVRAARDSETWRPDFAGAMLERVRERREGRAKAIFTALGGATALSLAANFVVVTGLGSRLDAALHPQPLVGIVRDAPLHATRAAALAPNLLADARAAARRKARERAARLALAKHHPATSDAADLLNDPVDSRESERKLIPTDGVVVADPLAGTPLAASVATSNAPSPRSVAVEARSVIRETLRR